MNLQQLEYFVCVADKLNFTAAARELHITQSALSQSINKMEAELNTPLFVKDGRNIKMTPDAESFYIHAKSAIESVNIGISAIKAKENTLLQPVNLLVAMGINTHYLASMVNGWLKGKPFVPLRINQRAINDIYFDIKTNNVDFAIMPIVESNPLDEALISIPIYRDRYYAVMSEDNELSVRESILLNDLNTQTLVISNNRIKDTQLNEFTENGFALKNYMIVSDISELGIILASTNTAVHTTCTPYSPTTCKGLHIRCIPIIDACMQYHLVWKEGRKLSPIQLDFKKFITNFCKQPSTLLPDLSHLPESCRIDYDNL